MDDERVGIVRELVMAYVRSPSIKHIRDPYSVDRLAPSG